MPGPGSGAGTGIPVEPNSDNDKRVQKRKKSEPGRDELPFGLSEEGLLVHISQAKAKGLACGLTCPDCGRSLVAYLNVTKKRRHYAHRARGECRYGAESGLHKYAKQVIARHLKVKLPEVRAANGELIHGGREQPLDSVRLETRHHGIIPDIIATRESRELLIEIVVTHRCDERKLAILAERELPTVEIDLSDVDVGDDLSMLDEAILRGSERWWVFHPRIDEASRREADAAREALAVAERKRLAAADALATQIEAWRGISDKESDGWETSGQFLDDVEMCGLRDILGVRSFGDWLLREPGTGWQATLLWLVLTYRKSKTRTVRPADVVALLEEQQLLRDGIRGVSPELWACAAERAPGLATPLGLATAFVDKLCSVGLVDARGTLDQEKAEQAMQRRAVLLDARRVAARQKREADALRKVEEARELAHQQRSEKLLAVQARVTAAVEQLINALGDEGVEQFDIEAWWDTPLWDGRTPLKRIEHELEGRETLYHEVVAMQKLAEPGATPVRNLLNLPVQRVQALRKAEAVSKWQAENEPLRRKRLDRLNEFDDDQAWFETPLAELGGLTPRGAAVESDEMYKQVYEIARLRQLSRERSRKAVAPAMARSTGNLARMLRDAAEHCYPGRAHLWMDTTHNRLGGQPSELCKSEKDMERCLDQLEADARLKLPARFRRSR